MTKVTRDFVNYTGSGVPPANSQVDMNAMNEIKNSINDLYYTDITLSSNNIELLFDKNYQNFTPYTATGNLVYTLASSGNIAGHEIVHEITLSATRTITFNGTFTTYNVNSGDTLSIGTHIFKFIYTGSKVIVERKVNVVDISGEQFTTEEKAKVGNLPADQSALNATNAAHIADATIHLNEAGVQAIDRTVSATQQTALDAKASTSALSTHTSSTANPHSVTASQVGLGNVDNTSDTDKPISTATQTALDLKAPLESPDLTGTPTVPTAAQGANTAQAANTAFVQSAIGLIEIPEVANFAMREVSYATSVTDTYNEAQPNFYINLAGDIDLSIGSISSGGGIVNINRSTGSESINLSGTRIGNHNYPTDASSVIRLTYSYEQGEVVWYCNNPTEGVADFEFIDENKGIILADRNDVRRWRLYVNDGTLGIEEVLTIPPAPTGGIVDDEDDTFTFTPAIGYAATEHEYNLNSAGFTDCASNVISVGDIDVPVGNLLVRVKSAIGRTASSAMSNADRFVSTTFIANFTDDDSTPLSSYTPGTGAIRTLQGGWEIQSNQAAAISTALDNQWKIIPETSPSQFTLTMNATILESTSILGVKFRKGATGDYWLYISSDNIYIFDEFGVFNNIGGSTVTRGVSSVEYVLTVTDTSIIVDRNSVERINLSFTLNTSDLNNIEVIVQGASTSGNALINDISISPIS